MSKKVEIPVDVETQHHFPLTAQHITTHQFMAAMPLVCQEIAPNSHGSISVKSFLRLNPVAQPLLGQVAIHNRAFFVRASSVWPAFYDFIADTPHITDKLDQIPTSAPVVRWDSLNDALAQFADPVTTTTGRFDFVASGVRYALNQTGRVFASILIALGYPFGVPNQSSSTNVARFNALPLLSFARILIDWYYPVQYAGITNTYITALKLLRHHESFEVDAGGVTVILQLAKSIMYDDDLFINAWDNPYAPNSGAFSDYYFPVIYGVDSQGEARTVGIDVNPDGSVSSDNSFITAPFLATLDKVTSYLKTHQLAGARALDRWLLDFGRVISSDKLDRSYYLGHDDAPIQFGIVESTSDTSGAALGDYAGKGVGYVDGKAHEFDSREDFGYLIVINTLVPQTAVVQGFKRFVRHIGKFDFYTPKLDGVMPSAIARGELYVSDRESSINDDAINKVFGFAPIYYEYKDLLPTLSGDFRFNSVNAGLDQWHMFRMFDDRNYYLSHSPEFLSGGADQFMRLFQATDLELGDPVKAVHWINLDMTARMRPLYDDYLLEHLDDGDHKKISTEINGVNLN